MTPLDHGLINACSIASLFWGVVLMCGVGIAILISIGVFCAIVLAAGIDENSQHLQSDPGYGAGGNGDTH